MEEMDKQVIIEDTELRDEYAILYAQTEGQVPYVHVCMNELEANNYMKEYERSGFFTRPIPWALGRVEVMKPVMMIKTKIEKVLRKEVID